MVLTQDETFDHQTRATQRKKERAILDRLLNMTLDVGLLTANLLGEPTHRLVVDLGEHNGHGNDDEHNPEQLRLQTEEEPRSSQQLESGKEDIGDVACDALHHDTQVFADAAHHVARLSVLATMPWAI